MAEIQEHVAYLSQTIGPRPAGTEEEQQAALYITERLQKEAEFSAVVEDFNCNPDNDIPPAVFSALSFIAVVVAVLVPFLGILTFVVAAVTAILTVAEVFNKPVVSRLLNRGVSQNVIAKYEPGMTEEQPHGRQRKVVLVAHYDSGKVDRLVNSPLFPILPVLQWVSVGGIVAVAILLLIRIIMGSNGISPFPLFILTVIAAVCALLPLIATIIRRGAPYNEGANCNAAGVSVMLEVANRIGNGKVSEAEFVTILHSREAARAAGLVPDGADLVYETDADEADGRDPAERLLAAKAAVAAMTGKAVPEIVNIEPEEALPEYPTPEEMLEAREEDQAIFGPQDSIAAASGAIVIDAENAGEHPVPQPQASEQDEQMASQMVEEGTPSPEAAAQTPVAMPVVPPKKEPSVPDWFTAAQRKAKKQESRPNTVHRSRYAEALEAAERERAERIAAEAPEEPALSETERRLQEMRDSIMGVKSPTYEGMLEKQAQAAAAMAAAANATKQAEAPDAVGAADGAESEEARAAANAAVAKEGKTIAFTPMMMEEIEASLQPSEQSTLSQKDAKASETGVKVEAEIVLPKDATEEAKAIAAAQAGSSATNVVVVEQANIQVDDVVVSLTPPDSEFTPHPAITEYKTGDSVKEKASAALSSVLPPSISAKLPFIGEDGSVKSSKDKPVHEVGESAAAQEAKHAAAAKKTVSPSAAERKPKRKQRSISLPSISATDTPLEPELKPLDEISMQQPAPLAEPRQASSNRVHDLSGVIPSIADDDQPRMKQVVHPAQIPGPKQSGIIPSLDTAERSGEDDGATAPAAEAAGSLVIPSITGSIKPVKNEHKHSRDRALDVLFASTAEAAEDAQTEAVAQDAIVADVDDSDYVEYGAEEGSFAVPGLVEMPKSRASRFFDRFGKGRKSKNDSTPQEWLDVDDDFDAREVGKARGGWESFKREDGDSAYTASAFDEEGYDDYESFEEYDDLDTFKGGSGRGSHWNGGMFSRDLFDSVGPLEEISNTGRVNLEEGAQSQASAQEAQAAAIAAAAIAAAQREIAAESNAQKEPPADEAIIDEEELQAAEQDLSRVMSFRHPDINTEVWFVALGSELAANGGMKAFIAEHAQELRGAIIIDLEGLGAGELSLIDTEGTYFPKKTSSRMERLARKAAAPLGLKVQKATMKWRNSAAAYAMQQGYQAMHLAGMIDNRPAYFGKKTDVVENIDTETMLVNADFVMELLKGI